MRTGVTAEQSAGGMTLNLCLREVDRCRPYFLCMLGERYGWCQAPEGEGVGTDMLLKKTFDNTISQYPEFQWISNYSSASVTELEIREGVLNSPEDCKHALFLFRNPEYMNDLLNEGTIAMQELSSFESESELSKQRLNSLKNDIRLSGVPVVSYDHHTDIRQIVTTHLKEAILRDFPTQDLGNAEDGALAAERREHKAFAESRCRVYVGQQHYYETLNQYIQNLPDPSINTSSSCPSTEEERQNSVFYIHGASGSGKSSLVANWVHLLQSDKTPLAESVCFTHLHFVGSSSSSSDPTHMLHRLLQELRARFLLGNVKAAGDKDDDALPYDWEHLLLLLPEVLQGVSIHLERKNSTRPPGSLPSVVVIVLDALNQLSDPDPDDSGSSTDTSRSSGENKASGSSTNSRHSTLSWLPRYLPPYIRLVVSSISLPEIVDLDIQLPQPSDSAPSDAPPPLVLTPSRALPPLVLTKHNCLEVLPLDKEGVKGIAVSYMSGYGKTLGENQIKMLMTCEQTKNPLFLRSVLEEVRMWGKFELLTDQMAVYLQKETIGDLFDAILSRLETDFNTAQYPTLVGDSMRALWGSHAGLTESELHAMLGSPRCVFSGLYLSIRQNLTNRNGLLYFFHDYLKQTVEKKYLCTLEDKVATHLMIATYFASSAVGDENIYASYREKRKRCLIEVTWQLSCCEQLSSLNLLLTLPSITQLLYENCKINLFKMLRMSGGTQGYKVAAESFVRECSWLFSTEVAVPPGDNSSSSSDEVKVEEGGLCCVELKSCIDKIVLEERKVMLEWPRPSRVAIVKQIADILIQAAEYYVGSQLLDLALQHCDGEEERLSIIAEQAKVCLLLSRYAEGISLCEPIVQSLADSKKEAETAEAGVDSQMIKKRKISVSYVDVTYSLAKLYSANGQYPAADPLFQIVLDARLSLYGEIRGQTADVLSAIARHNLSQRRYVEALDLFQRVLAIRRVTTGEKTPTYIASVRDIGMLYHDLAEYEKAERYFTNALEATAVVFGSCHPAVADVINELAFSKYMRHRGSNEKMDEIIALYEQALAIRIASYGDMHIDVANTLNHMANVYRAQVDLGDPAAITQAIQLYSRARVIKETKLHAKHPEVLLSRNNIANILLMTSQFAEAAKEHEAILSLRQEIYGMGNIQNATSLKNCGLAYLGLGDFEKSLVYHLEALRIRQSGFGVLHPKTAESNACVGDVLVALSRPLEAVQQFQAAATAWDAILGVGNRDRSARALKVIEQLTKGETVTERLHVLM